MNDKTSPPTITNPTNPTVETPGDNGDPTDDEPAEDVYHSAFEVIEIFPKPEVINDIIVISDISSYTLKGFDDAESVRFSTVFVDASHLTPIVIGFDGDGSDGWRVEGSLPGKGKMLLFIEINQRDGSTQKLSGIPLLSNIDIPHLFDPREINAGDNIVGWTIKSLDLVPDASIGFSGIIHFEGEKKLTGTYRVIPPENEVMGPAICFTPDEESEKQLPRMMLDYRGTYFCASNYSEIEPLFSEVGNEGEMSLIIQDYIMDHRPTETWNSAKFVFVDFMESNQ